MAKPNFEEKGKYAQKKNWKYLFGRLHKILQCPCTRPGTLKIEASLFLITTGAVWAKSEVWVLGLQEIHSGHRFSLFSGYPWLWSRKFPEFPSYVSKLVNEINQYSLLTCIQFHNFVGQC